MNKNFIRLNTNDNYFSFGNFCALGKVFSVKQLTFQEIYCTIYLIEKIISRIVKNPLQ